MNNNILSNIWIFQSLFQFNNDLTAINSYLLNEFFIEMLKYNSYSIKNPSLTNKLIKFQKINSSFRFCSIHNDIKLKLVKENKYLILIDNFIYDFYKENLRFKPIKLKFINKLIDKFDDKKIKIDIIDVSHCFCCPLKNGYPDLELVSKTTNETSRTYTYDNLNNLMKQYNLYNVHMVEHSPFVGPFGCREKIIPYKYCVENGQKIYYNTTSSHSLFQVRLSKK